MRACRGLMGVFHWYSFIERVALEVLQQKFVTGSVSIGVQVIVYFSLEVLHWEFIYVHMFHLVYFIGSFSLEVFNFECFIWSVAQGVLQWEYCTDCHTECVSLEVLHQEDFIGSVSTTILLIHRDYCTGVFHFECCTVSFGLGVFHFECCYYNTVVSLRVFHFELVLEVFN